MKKIEAVVQPFKLDEIHEALREGGFSGLTVIEAKGYGRQKGATAIYRGTEYNIELIPKIKLELVCTDDKADKAISIIVHSAKTGQIGDGKIFISSVEQAIRIRTEESGDQVL